MGTYNGWETIRELGKGAQGTVYLARYAKSQQNRKAAVDYIERIIRQISTNGAESVAVVERLAEALARVTGDDPRDTLGAVKVFNVSDAGPDDRNTAAARLEKEFTTLKALDDLAVLRPIEANFDKAGDLFLITEYYPKGTLHEHLDAWKGQPLKALEAFRPLVNAVRNMHKLGVIHRDIKPKNIFVGRNDALVLGDFGIVFYTDDDGTRVTGAHERKGSRDWMPSWAYPEERIDEPDETLDIYPLGKVLWSMVSGKPNLLHWFWQKPQYNLTTIFTNIPTMGVINNVLSKCVVEEKKDCLHMSSELLDVVDQSIKLLQKPGERPADDDVPWQCRMCGKGRYPKEPYYAVLRLERRNQPPANPETVRVYVCDNCKHLEFFRVNAP